MARKSDSGRWFNVAVVGLSGTEKEKGALGIGKSCLCNRFLRSLADEYSVDHISVLSQSDFSGRVVNNDHFLYWGEVSKISDEGIDFQFQVIEQTEFIDDASFQPFKGGKMEPYVKRCVTTKLTSAEKLMYICKNQLGIEKEYEQKILTDGKISIDGFLCLFDVSVVPSRSLEKQVEVVTSILNNIIKTKKPVVLVTTKNDDSNELYVKEVEKIVTKKEYKGAIPVVETSAHENINVDLAFITLAQLIDRNKGRLKAFPYIEAARARKEHLDHTTEAFQNLIRSQITDYRTLWSHAYKKFSKYEELIHYTEEFGIDNTQRLFRRHVKKLKDEHLAKKVQGYMDMLPDILQEMIPDISDLRDCDWPNVQQHIKNHPDFNHYFYKSNDDVPWTEYDWENEDGNCETRIPYDVLDTGEAESVFKNHANALEQEHKRLEWKKMFKLLLEETGYVTPGKSLGEVRVLFMGRECFENLSEQDCLYIYENHQKEIAEKAKHNFQELLLEHAGLFYHFKSIAPTGTITQDDIKEITDSLKEDSRYKALDRLDQDRKLMLFQHLGFVHCPIREHCPAFPNCMDALIERILVNKAHRPSSWNNSGQWMLNADNNQLNLVILGSTGLGHELACEIKGECDDDEFEIDCQLYSLEYRVIDGDVSLPQNSFQSSEFLPHGCFCVYSNSESFEYVRESLEKTLLSNLEQDDRLPFQGLPIVLMFVGDENLDEKEIARLQEEGQSLSDSLQCPFIDASLEEDIPPGKRFSPSLVVSALRQLLQSIRHRAGFVNIYQSVMECTEPDIRIIMCMFCGDPYSVENVLAPLLNHQCCFLSGERSIILETFLGSSKRKVEVIISSFHGANAFREELIHGFVLVYSTKRKASLATLNAFSMNIPNLPIQILAVTDTGGANAFFSNDVSHQLITEGNATADRLQAHFMTFTSSFQQKTAFYTPFFKEVWEKKPEIEQAFHMEEPATTNNENKHLSRNHPYHIKLPSNEGLMCDMYERMASDERFSPTYSHEHIGVGSGSEDSDTYSPVDTQHKMNSKSQNKLHHADVSGSRESLTTHDSGWVDGSLYLQHTDQQDEGGWHNNYSQHAFTTGRTQASKPRFKGSLTMKQPGKLNMKEFSLVTDAIARMNINSNKENSHRMAKIGKSIFGHAPLATPEPVDLGSEYSQVKDAVSNSYSTFDGEYAYPHVQDSGLNKHKARHRRDKGRMVISDSDSDEEVHSSDRRQKTINDAYRKPSTHKRVRKKRTAIPVATPRVPNMAPSSGSSSQLTTKLAVSEPNALIESGGLVSQSHDKSDSDSLSQETGLSDGDGSSGWPNNSCNQNSNLGGQARAHMKRKSTSETSRELSQENHSYTSSVNRPKLEESYSVLEDETNLDAASPRDINSPMTKEEDKTLRRKEKQKSKDEVKQEKRRVKEEKLKKVAEDKKKQKGKATSKSNAIITHQATFEDFVQSDTNAIPLLLEKCVNFVEEEGLDSEGIYRVPGNRAHVELLFNKFEEEPNLDISTLDIPVNAIATALKDFFSKRLPPLFPQEIMSELEELSAKRFKGDKSCRLLALRGLLKKLPSTNFQILKFVFRHFVRVSENCKLNSMDSKNLAICWWPTLLPIEFSDMGRFEQMRPHLEDIIQTMIDQYPFLFCGKEAFVMV